MHPLPTKTAIRRERDSDYAQVERLVAAAFAPIQESEDDEPLLVQRLRKSKAFIPELSLVAERQGRVVGHIILTRIRIANEGGSTDALALAPVSVLPECQRQGVGGQLIEESHRVARRLGYPAIVLVGHKEYYPRFGYKPASHFGIELPFDVPEEFCMAVELWEGALQGVSGRVVYPAAFFGAE